MASNILGRTPCPISCGHDAAHVKIKTDKAAGTAYPYIHCRGCGVQLHTRNDEQAAHLARATRAEKLDAVPASAAPVAPPAKIITPPPAPPPAITPPAARKQSIAAFIFGDAP